MSNNRPRWSRLRAETRARAAVARSFFRRRLHRGSAYGLALTLSVVAIFAALWLFLEIMEDAAAGERLGRMDRRVQELLQAVFSPGLTRWVVRVTNLGATPGIVTLGVIVGLWLVHRRRWWSLFGLLYATAGGGLLMHLLKALFQRARPEDKLIPAGGYSFPSGHSFTAIVFFGFLIYLTWKLVRPLPLRLLLTVVCLFLILLIGSSRVYLQVHWLTDVLGGFTAGFIWLVMSIVIVHLLEHPDTREV